MLAKEASLRRWASFASRQLASPTTGIMLSGRVRRATRVRPSSRRAG